jgi:hypothetical protein
LRLLFPITEGSVSITVASHLPALILRAGDGVEGGTINLLANSPSGVITGLFLTDGGFVLRNEFGQGIQSSTYGPMIFSNENGYKFTNHDPLTTAIDVDYQNIKNLAAPTAAAAAATKAYVDAKQDKLTAGENITITGNTISATGCGGGGGLPITGDGVSITNPDSGRIDIVTQEGLNIKTTNTPVVIHSMTGISLETEDIGNIRVTFGGNGVRLFSVRFNRDLFYFDDTGFYGWSAAQNAWVLIFGTGLYP